MDKKEFESRLGDLILNCPECKRKVSQEEHKKWHDEFDEFLFSVCSEEQGSKAIELYQLHVQNGHQFLNNKNV